MPEYPPPAPPPIRRQPLKRTAGTPCACYQCSEARRADRQRLLFCFMLPLAVFVGWHAWPVVVDLLTPFFTLTN